MFEQYLHPPISGEPRAVYFNVKDPVAFSNYFNKRFSRRFYLVEKKQAIAKNLFSENTVPLKISERDYKENISRIGDYIAIAKRGYSLHFKHHGKTYTLKGKHGSLTREELLVPLLIFS